MALPNNIGDILALTAESFSSMVSDNVTNHIPLFFFLNERGNIVEFSGGPEIDESLSYAENGTGRFYAGYETLDVSASETLSKAKYAIKQYNVNVVVSGLEEAQNSGPARIFDLVGQRVEVAKQTYMNDMGASIFSDGTGSGGKELDGLQLQIADDPTTGVAGGINRATFSFWRNKLYSFATESVTPSKTTMRDSMDVMYRRILRNSDRSTVVVAGETYYGFFKAGLQDQERFSNTRLAESGFENVMFNATPVLFDGNCSATRMYFLNTNSIRLRPVAGKNFVAEAPKKPVNQDAHVIPTYWYGNLVCNNMKLNGVMTA